MLMTLPYWIKISLTLLVFTQLKEASPPAGLKVNDSTTKYITMMRQSEEQNINIHDHKFENVQTFKYLGLTKVQ